MAEYNTAKRPLIVFALLLSAAAASAQPTPGKPGLPTENVTVSDTKSREVIQDFVSALAVQTQNISKIARWETGICPITVGLPPLGGIEYRWLRPSCSDEKTMRPSAKFREVSSVRPGRESSSLSPLCQS